MVFFGLLLFSVGGVLAMGGGNTEGEIVINDEKGDAENDVDTKKEVNEPKKEVLDDLKKVDEPKKEVNEPKKEVLDDLKKEVNKTTWFRSNVIEKWSNLGPKHKSVLKYGLFGGVTVGVSTVALLNRGKIGRACSGSLGYMKKLILRRSSV